MLLVITAFCVPKELLHELHHHTDTIDNNYTANSNKEVGSKHIHCDVFQFNGQVLFYSYQLFSFTEDFTPYTYSSVFYDDYFHQSTCDNFQRGPPKLVIG
jgi:hypothetical protein